MAKKPYVKPEGAPALPEAFMTSLKAHIDEHGCPNRLDHTITLFIKMGIPVEEMEKIRLAGCRCDCDVVQILGGESHSEKKVLASCKA